MQCTSWIMKLFTTEKCSHSHHHQLPGRSERLECKAWPGIPRASAKRDKTQLNYCQSWPQHDSSCYTFILSQTWKKKPSLQEMLLEMFLVCDEGYFLKLWFSSAVFHCEEYVCFKECFAKRIFPLRWFGYFLDLLIRTQSYTQTQSQQKTHTWLFAWSLILLLLGFPRTNLNSSTQ